MTKSTTNSTRDQRQSVCLVELHIFKQFGDSHAEGFCDLADLRQCRFLDTAFNVTHIAAINFSKHCKFHLGVPATHAQIMQSNSKPLLEWCLTLPRWSFRNRRINHGPSYRFLPIEDCPSVDIRIALISEDQFECLTCDLGNHHKIQ